MFEPKPISKEGIPAAYRRRSATASSTTPARPRASAWTCCRWSPDNQQALVTLLLAITDQFGTAPTEGVRRAREVLPRLQDEYKRTYYAGIICERCAKAQLRSGMPRSGQMAYQWFRDAMSWYEKAESQRPAGNDEAILRWNTCGRILARYPQLQPGSDEPVVLSLE